MVNAAIPNPYSTFGFWACAGVARMARPRPPNTRPFTMPLIILPPNVGESDCGLAWQLLGGPGVGPEAGRYSHKLRRAPRTGKGFRGCSGINPTRLFGYLAYFTSEQRCSGRVSNP